MYSCFFFIQVNCGKVMKGPVMIFYGIYCIPPAAQHGECLSLTFNTFPSHPPKQKEYCVFALCLGH